MIAAPALSPQHYRDFSEKTAGPLRKIVESLTETEPDKLAQIRRDLDALVEEYFENNVVRQDYLMTRAVKV
jgi:hypothetical protein